MAIVRKQKKNPVISPPDNTKTAEDIYQIAEKNRIKTLPFDIEKLITLFGIEICFEDLDRLMSGYIEKRNSSWVVGVNKYHSPRRQRFTLAHELSHYLLHKEIIEQKKHTDKNLFRDETSNQIEKEANDLASEILIPQEEFKKQVDNGNRNFLSLADYFNVSIAAARYKAYKLGYISSF